MERAELKNLISSINPYDDIEAEFINDVLAWIDSGSELYRIESPNIPPKHLVSYTVTFDPKEKKILLLYVKKASLWLPNGGHVDIDESPTDAAKREFKEELNEEGKMIFNEKPLFLTVGETVGTVTKHVDVSLWYVFERDSNKALQDKGSEFTKEFKDYKWLNCEEILKTNINELDPAMHTFVKKLIKKLDY